MKYFVICTQVVYNLCQVYTIDLIDHRRYFRYVDSEQFVLTIQKEMHQFELELAENHNDD
jgi:hypothetical protein